MIRKFNEQANTQYGTFLGSNSSDVTDAKHIEDFLGIDSSKQCLVRVEINYSGFGQQVVAFGFDLADHNLNEFIDKANSGEVVELKQLVDIDYNYPNHSDTNPPRPANLPVGNANEFLSCAFKRLQLVLQLSADRFNEEASYKIID